MTGNKTFYEFINDIVSKKPAAIGSGRGDVFGRMVLLFI